MSLNRIKQWKTIDWWIDGGIYACIKQINLPRVSMFYLKKENKLKLTLFLEKDKIKLDKIKCITLI